MVTFYVKRCGMELDNFRSLVLAHLTLAVAQREAEQARKKPAN